jgi:hypothetical protein
VAVPIEELTGGPPWLKGVSLMNRSSVRYYVVRVLVAIALVGAVGLQLAVALQKLYAACQHMSW